MVFASFQCNGSNRDTNLKPYESLAYEKAKWGRARLCAYRELAAWRKPAKAEKDSAFKARSAGRHGLQIRKLCGESAPRDAIGEIVETHEPRAVGTAAAHPVPSPGIHQSRNSIDT
jgi:hypothetical protein